MFSNCSNLVNIPILDFSNVTGLNKTFKGCVSLSNDSLNNIMQMCINATSYTGTKSLDYIGIPSQIINNVKNLPNYQAFLSAGWTIW